MLQRAAVAEVVSPGELRVALLRLNDLAAPPVVLEGVAFVLWTLFTVETTHAHVAEKAAVLWPGEDLQYQREVITAFVDDLLVLGLLEESVTHE
ncbi:hypothetical protein G7072_00125 [Nocardioides sp. HDW12B]|uniref:hypothetical protein n=1 Tax=Nocardioides sp. HDW12B TaxID=2714939 RepID=UPI00140BD666|nr:hypothetical protein [Nocardioides sp. HDW12B]QIK64950.1 hypothetical protein G7072_00125 [Nocardioides sp. HDW12B]